MNQLAVNQKRFSISMLFPSLVLLGLGFYFLLSLYRDAVRIGSVLKVVDPTYGSLFLFFAFAVLALWMGLSMVLAFYWTRIDDQGVSHPTFLGRRTITWGEIERVRIRLRQSGGTIQLISRHEWFTLYWDAFEFPDALIAQIRRRATGAVVREWS